MKKRVKNFLDEVKLEISPMTETKEGKISGGYAAFSGDVEVGEVNYRCPNDCLVNDICLNKYCKNFECGTTTTTTTARSTRS